MPHGLLSSDALRAQANVQITLHCLTAAKKHHPERLVKAFRAAARLPPQGERPKHAERCCPPSDNLRRTIYSRGHCPHPPGKQTTAQTHMKPHPHSTSAAQNSLISPLLRCSPPAPPPQATLAALTLLNTLSACFSLFHPKTFFPPCQFHSTHDLLLGRSYVKQPASPALAAKGPSLHHFFALTTRVKSVTKLPRTEKTRGRCPGSG
jgi:hypothetical protein